MTQIVVATDGSEGGDRAVTAAARLAHGLGAGLTVVTVEGQPEAVSRAEELAPRIVGDALDQQAERILRAAAERARDVGLATVRTEALWGDPAVSIIDAVQRHHADMVVVGRRGRGRLSGLLLGSVSQKLASLAPCTVVIAP